MGVLDLHAGEAMPRLEHLCQARDEDCMLPQDLLCQLALLRLVQLLQAGALGLCPRSLDQLLLVHIGCRGRRIGIRDGVISGGRTCPDRAYHCCSRAGRQNRPCRAGQTLPQDPTYYDPHSRHPLRWQCPSCKPKTETGSHALVAWNQAQGWGSRARTVHKSIS